MDIRNFHLKPVIARLRRRFNPRLHPLLAAGIGLGLVALWLPSPAPDREAHSEEEILAGLVASELDLAHGPRFWLRELRQGSELAERARALCSEPPNPIRPGCQLLATLERIEAKEAPWLLPQPEPGKRCATGSRVPLTAGTTCTVCRV